MGKYQNEQENQSVAENAGNKLVSIVQLLNPFQRVKDVVNYTKEYLDDTKPAFEGSKTRIPKSQEDKEQNYFTGLFKTVGGQNLERAVDGISFLNFITPSQWYGAYQDGKQNGFSFRRMGNSILDGNSGFVSPEEAANHPVKAMLTNATGDILLSSPRAILNLGRQGLRYLDDITRNFTPPASPALAVVNNGILEFNPSIVQTPQVNGISIIPSVNNTASSYMALGEVSNNPQYVRGNTDFSKSKAYPKKQEITPEEQDFMNTSAEQNNVDLSGLNTSWVYVAPRKFGMNSISREVGNAIGLAGKPTFADYLYKQSRQLPAATGDSEKLFKKLGVYVDGQYTSQNVSNGRALAADIKGQLFTDGFLTKENLLSRNFDFTADDLVEYLNTAHDGVYGRHPNRSIYGFKKIKTKDPYTGAETYTLDWDEKLTESQKEQILNLWKQAILSYKNGNKLLPRPSSIKLVKKYK